LGWMKETVLNSVQHVTFIVHSIKYTGTVVKCIYVVHRSKSPRAFGRYKWKQYKILEWKNGATQRNPRNVSQSYRQPAQ